MIETKKQRRLEVGPHACFYFESYDTMWTQVHEMLLIEKGGGIVQTYAVASIPEPYQAQFYDPADAARDPVMQRVRVSSAPVAWSNPAMSKASAESASPS